MVEFLRLEQPVEQQIMSAVSRKAKGVIGHPLQQPKVWWNSCLTDPVEL